MRLYDVNWPILYKYLLTYTYYLHFNSDGTGTRNQIFEKPGISRMVEGKLNEAYLHFLPNLTKMKKSLVKLAFNPFLALINWRSDFRFH